MFGFFFGAACLVGLAVVAARGHRYHGHWHHRRHGGYGPPWGMRGALYSVLARLDATPTQEKVILGAAQELTDTVRKARGSLRQVRDAAARAVKGDAFDEAPLGEAFTAQDASLAEIRGAVTSAGRKIHDVLDERQRKTLADLIDAGPFGWRGFGHAHGHHC